MFRSHLFVLTISAAVLALGSGIRCTSGSVGGGSSGSASGCQELGSTCDKPHRCCSGLVCNEDGVCAEEKACVEEGGGCDADSPCCEPLTCKGVICVADGGGGNPEPDAGEPPDAGTEDPPGITAFNVRPDSKTRRNPTTTPCLTSP